MSRGAPTPSRAWQVLVTLTQTSTVMWTNKVSTKHCSSRQAWKASTLQTIIIITKMQQASHPKQHQPTTTIRLPLKAFALSTKITISQTMGQVEAMLLRLCPRPNQTTRTLHKHPIWLLRVKGPKNSRLEERLPLRKACREQKLKLRELRGRNRAGQQIILFKAQCQYRPYSN